MNPAFLFMIEGLNQPGLSVCWGNGFAVDTTAISKFTGAATAAPFFDQLLDKPYSANVIIAPHFYGPSISKSTAGYSGSALVNSATTTFGYLGFGKGYCRADGKCQKFPIIIGAKGARG